MRIWSRGMAAVLAAGVSIISLPARSQEAIIVVRHSDPPPMLRLDEIRDDTPLSESGQQRAMMLAGRLKDSRVSAIYVSEALRTAQTAQPLAETLGIQSQVHLGDDVDGLVKRIRSEHQGKRVLIVGHWSTIPAILKALGHPQDVAIERSAYDNLFIVVPQGEQVPPTVVHLHY